MVHLTDIKITIHTFKTTTASYGLEYDNSHNILVYFAENVVSFIMPTEQKCNFLQCFTKKNWISYMQEICRIEQDFLQISCLHEILPYPLSNMCRKCHVLVSRTCRKS